MRTLLLLLNVLVFATAPLARPADKKAPNPKPAVIEVIEAAAHRSQDTLNIDGKVRNTGERPAANLVIIVDVLDLDKQPLTTQTGDSEPETIEPGEEGEFHAQMALPPRAVYFRLSFEDGTSKRDLKGIKTGPFAIE